MVRFILKPYQLTEKKLWTLNVFEQGKHAKSVVVFFFTFGFYASILQVINF